MTKFIIITVFSVLFFCFTDFTVNADEYSENIIRKRIETLDIDKFQAHQHVSKLQQENLKKIQLIEIISHNFGYTEYKKLKKDYWTACILVPKREIIQAEILLQKNKEEIDETLRVISNDYYNITQQMLDECIEKVNELEFSSDIKTNPDKQKKLSMFKDTIRLANFQLDTAHGAFQDKRYVASISLFRGVKSYAIAIMRDMAEPDEVNKINDKFKIHIVDNRNEIYTES